MSVAKLKPYAKAIVLTLLIVVTFVADVLGAPVGLDAQHYIGLLIADLAVWAVPNKGYVYPDNTTIVKH